MTVVSWELVDLPVGPQPLPRWALGLHVDWSDGYGNPPDFLLKANRQFYEWPDKRWTRKGHAFTALHHDGRGEVHFHGGAIREVELTRRVRTSRTEWRDETYTALATTQDEGYSGRHFPVIIGGKDPLRGKKVILRGPWYGGSPAGHVSVNVVNVDDGHVRRQVAPRWRRPWYQHTACFGTGIREDVFIRIFARFLPHLRLARVTEDFGGKIYVSLQPLKPEWDAPKGVILQRERAAWEAAEEARWEAREQLLQPVRDLGFEPTEWPGAGRQHKILLPDGGFISISRLAHWHEHGPRFSGQRASGADLASLVERLRGVRQREAANA